MIAPCEEMYVTGDLRQKALKQGSYTMARSQRPLNHQRLVEISDAVLSASEEQPGTPQPDQPFRSASARHPLEMMRDGSRHPALSRFTWPEIEQACRFLIRLGMMAAPPRPGPA